MTGITRFEEIVAWQKARELTRKIYGATNKQPINRDMGLSRQMQRASVSVMSNIAEGFERGADKEFHRFLVIAKGSCAELRSQLYIALDVGYLTKDEFEALFALSEEVSRIVGALRASVARRIR